MKQGICIFCVPGSSLAEQYANASSCGFEGIEIITPRDAAETREHKALAARHGLRICSVMTEGSWQHPLSSPEAAVRAKGEASVAASIEAAAELGADLVLVVPGVVTPEVTYEQAWERSAGALRRLLPAAAKAKVTLGIENVWNKFLLSPVEFAAYVDSLGSEWAGAYFDVANIVAYGIPEHWIATLGRRVRRVHVKGFHAESRAWTQLLEGTVDWAASMKALRRIGYDGHLIVEVGPAGPDPLAGLAKIKADLDAIMKMGG